MSDRIIKVLSKDVAAKIAAGEVVERPLSVVKELVENAIDAGSTSIVVEIKAGGKDYIRVSDNGCGIERIQLPVAFKRYATSKIDTADDLNDINTLGFRGEALASIAAVAKVGITTKTEASQMGSSMHINGGQVKSIEDAACENGTTITVKNLFYNTPARQKFLKADNVEGALVIDFVSKAAIAYPEIAFRMISNSSILFSTNGKGDLLMAIAVIYGPEIAKNLIPCSFDDGMHKVTGYISSPTISKTNKQWETFFVNGRVIKSKLLEDSISSAYRDKLFKEQFPVAFLFLTLPPTAIDVNVHPHKTEIKFFDEEDVREFLVQSIRMALLNPNALNVTRFTKDEADIAIVNNRIEQEQREKAEQIENRFAEVKEKKVAFAEAKEEAEAIEEQIKTEENEVKLQAETIFKDTSSDVKEVEVQEEVTAVYNKPADDKLYFSNLKYIGQAFETYLICKDNDNIYLIDQHAAHERVMYEKLLSEFNNEESLKQEIITPIVVELTMAQKTAALDSFDMLDKMGFVIEDFGPTSLVAKSIPACMDLEEAESFLEKFFEEVEDHSGNLQAKRDVIVSRSCKSAVKAHDKLSDKEVLKLFIDLDACENPFSCPHGRPTFLKFTNNEIERMFKRKK